MDPALLNVLKIFSIYSLPGFFFIWALKDSYRLERFLMGIVLIIWAAFALTMTTIVAGFLEPFISDANSNQYTLQQAKDFLPYILMFSFVFTFLFGGIGTNAVSSALMEKSSIFNNEELAKLQAQLNAISNRVDRLEKFHWKYFISSIVIFIIYIVGSAIVFR